MIKNLVISVLNLMARLAGRKMVLIPANDRYIGVLDLKSLTTYWRHDDPVTDFEYSMRATGMDWSDNIQKRLRYHSLYQVAIHVADRAKDEAEVAECGCWRGHSAHMISTILKKLQKY